MKGPTMDVKIREIDNTDQRFLVAEMLADALETLLNDLTLHAHGKAAPGHRQHIREAFAALHAAGRQGGVR